MKQQKTIVIIGATSSIAEHCARLWVQAQSVNLTLVGRDAGRLERVAQDLRVRSPDSQIRVVQAGFVEPADIEQCVDAIAAQGRMDVVLIAHGFLPEQADCQNDLQACQQALQINGISPVLYAEAVARHMTRADHGTLALIGSVAGDRGRKSNYIYGCAKGLVTRYAQGLQHRLAATAVKVVLIKPGPTATPMTAHLSGQGTGFAPVEDVAKIIVTAIERGQPLVYAPRKWALIMLVIRHLPGFVFRKLNI